MKKICLMLIILIIVGICIPAVSAEIILDTELSEWVDTSGNNTRSGGAGSYSDNTYFDGFYISDVTKARHLSYIVYEISDTQGRWKSTKEVIPVGRHDFTYTFDGVERPGVVYVERSTDILGQVTKSKFTFFFNDWDIGTLSGGHKITLPFTIYDGTTNSAGWQDWEGDYLITPAGNGYNRPGTYMRYVVWFVTGIPWKNHILVSDVDSGYEITLERTIDGEPYTSTVNISHQDVVLHSSTLHGTNETFWYPKTGVDLVKILSPSHQEYSYPLGVDSPPAPATATVTVYIKNSQTGAAIANSNIVIDALVNGEYYPVANTTEPSGIFTITLQPTGGGQPNPDSYRLIATADGYNNPMPEINFTVTDSKKYLYCYLDPIAGGPENENNTFIDFYVRDLSANPVSAATVKFGKYTLITNSYGYTVFEVPKNTDYTYTVSKSGYGSLTGNAVIGANDRYIINAVIGPAVTPTTPTAIPTATQTGPTPTLTAPTGEPVSNLLEWFAAHFGMLLGGGVEIGKIFMWLCFTVPVGVYVGKEAKAGAAGFMAGAGIVTLFFVIIGWVPIWLVILLALIIGLMYLKIFNAPDNGGGR